MDTRNIFPQANNLNLVLQVLTILSQNKNIPKAEISLKLDIVPRQVDYYINVLYYFDLVTEKNALTLKGRFVNDPVINEYDKLVILKNIIVEKQIFAEIDCYIKLHKRVPSNLTISEYIAKYYQLSQSTLIRRSSTVKSWFEYLIKQGVYEELQP